MSFWIKAIALVSITTILYGAAFIMIINSIPK
jgi:hypothetical protein